MHSIAYPSHVGPNHRPSLCQDDLVFHRFKWMDDSGFWLQRNNQLFDRIKDAKSPYQTKNLNAFRHYLGTTDGKHIVDIGANVGLMAYQFASWGCRVSAFEPTPKLAEMVAHNLKINHLDHMVDVYQNAISNITGPVTFRDQHDNGYINAIVKPATKTSPRSHQLTIEAYRLDDLLGELDHVDGLKVDTEGHEVAIILHGLDLIKRDRPVIMAELLGDRIKGMPKWGQDVTTLYATLHSLDYLAFNNRHQYHTAWSIPISTRSDIIFVPKEKLAVEPSFVW